MIKYFYLFTLTTSSKVTESEQYKFAFTLAEVLITLGIIGVVAALTMPSLISHKKIVESVNRFKKAYSVLNQTYKMSELDYGEIENWDWNLSTKDFFNKYFVPYINITKNCEDNVSSECWSDDGVIYYLNGNAHLSIKDGAYAKVKLSDGTLLAFQNQNSHAHFYIDTNGKVRPNMYGKDIFLLTLTKAALKETNMHNILHAGLWVYGTGINIDLIQDNCKSGASGMFCGAYLYFNSWQIPKDYPKY